MPKALQWNIVYPHGADTKKPRGVRRAERCRAPPQEIGGLARFVRSRLAYVLRFFI